MYNREIFLPFFIFISGEMISPGKKYFYSCMASMTFSRLLGVPSW